MRNTNGKFMMIRLLASGILCILMSLPVSVLAELSAKQPLLDEARQLLRAKAPGQAYLLLAAKEVEHAGDITFDYLLGMSALAAKRYIEATIALERVLIMNPNHVGARLDIGVAFFKMGALERAIDSFEQVLASNPPEHLKVVAEEALQLAQSGGKDSIRLEERLNGYVAFTLGTDSNINTASSSATTVAYFNGLPILLYLNPSSTAKSDQFARASGGLTYQLPINDKSQWEFDLGLSLLAPFKRSEYQTIDTSVNVGYQYFQDNNRWSLAGNLGGSWLDDNDYISYDGLTAGWRHSLDDENLLDFSAQWTRYRYEQSAQSINDFDQGVISGRLLHRVPGKPMIASFGVLAGYADALNASPDGDKVFVGFSYGLQGQTRYADTGFVNMAYKKSFHEKNNVSFLRQREDSQFDLKAGLTWNLEKDLALTGEVGITALNSNISIYSYQRRSISLTLRKNFSD